ncbi:MAG: DUF2779 domain-containing protein [Thermoplasmata archaeon]
MTAVLRGKAAAGRVAANRPVTTGTRNSKYLTKTRYVNGLACSKWLWLALNAPDRLPKIDESTRYRFDEGRQIGELARRRFPAGMLLPAENPEENEQRSRKLLDRRVPLFEAGFTHPDGACYARADVLLPVGRNGWDLVEVKSGGSVKEEYLHDVAFQRYCYTGAGLNIRKCSLLLINKKYERSGEIDPAQLFQEEDVTDAVKQVASTVQPNVDALLAVAHSKVCPEFGRGERFHEDEYGVHSDDAVWKEHPASDITDLYRGGNKVLQLLKAGVFRIRDIPKGFVLTEKQTVQRAAHTSGRTHMDRKKLATFLGGLRYPLHFLDFETVYPAIPLFDGTRPYQQIPFQFSVHVVDAPGNKPRAHSYLSLEPTDPREELLESLRKVIGPEGHLIAYNRSFEKSRLEELAKFLPEHAKWIRKAKGRFVDLLTPFRNFAYYNPAQGGSASLKAVLPAITGRGYDGFEIANGSQASLAYLYAAFGTGDGKKASPQEAGEVRRALERYCGQDTEGMVWIVEKLAELARSGTS